MLTLFHRNGFQINLGYKKIVINLKSNNEADFVVIVGRNFLFHWQVMKILLLQQELSSKINHTVVNATEYIFSSKAKPSSWNTSRMQSEPCDNVFNQILQQLQQLHTFILLFSWLH